MQKIILYLAFCLGLFASAQSQSFNVKMGKLYESNRFYMMKIVGSDDNGLYATGVMLNGLLGKAMVQKFDTSLNSVGKLGLAQKDNSVFEDMFLFPNQKFILYTSISNSNKQENKYELFASPIDTKNLTLSSTDTKLCSIVVDSKIRPIQEKISKTAISSDSSKLGLCVDFPTNNREGSNKFVFKVFTNELQELWSQEQIFPYQDRYLSIEDLKVSNSGNIYCLGKIDKKEGLISKRNESTSDSYHIYCISPNENKPIDIPVIVENNIITDIKIEIAANGDILCAGFYSSPLTKSIEINESGVFSLLIDGLTGQIKQQSKKPSSIYYGLKNLILKETGGFILVGEYVTMTNSTVVTSKPSMTGVPNPNGGVTTYSPNNAAYYKDIVVLNMDEKGDILWTEIIAKNQISSAREGMIASYALMVKKDMLYFIFNDNKKNLTYNGRGVPASSPSISNGRTVKFGKKS